jgi:hypothetical protein
MRVQATFDANEAALRVVDAILKLERRRELARPHPPLRLTEVEIFARTPGDARLGALRPAKDEGE